MKILYDSNLFHNRTDIKTFYNGGINVNLSLENNYKNKDKLKKIYKFNLLFLFNIIIYILD